ncbi:hypothetical protein NQ317_003717 [Molorchus minor]|uniref:Uncharacterized protein n=1 Tax=Molorchus minor TaxID=1323400 RepID=A0ABQ9K5I0_9CUCU|nr:hypothetical protein NQ317_003717 [Molorchus minor]
MAVQNNRIIIKGTFQSKRWNERIFLEKCVTEEKFQDINSRDEDSGPHLPHAVTPLAPTTADDNEFIKLDIKLSRYVRFASTRGGKNYPRTFKMSMDFSEFRHTLILHIIVDRLFSKKGLHIEKDIGAFIVNRTTD